MLRGPSLRGARSATKQSSAAHTLYASLDCRVARWAPRNDKAGVGRDRWARRAWDEVCGDQFLSSLILMARTEVGSYRREKGRLGITAPT